MPTTKLVITTLWLLTVVPAACAPAVAPDTSPPPVAAVPSIPAGLRASNPTLAYDPARTAWVSFSDSESLSSSFAIACDPGAPVWQKGFAHVPYRLGPTPSQLGACWDGDAMPGGPGSWASNAAGSVGSPSVAKLAGHWVLVYEATTAGAQQRCIGAAWGKPPGGSDSPIGTSWSQLGPLVCPSGGLSARDPELYHDTTTLQWFLLWTEDVSACDSRLMMQQLDPATVQLTGTARQLLSSTNPAVSYAAVAASSCPGSVRRRIESPTMVRADNGSLWLLFSANDRDSGNYATGWAVCGTGSPTDAGECGVPSAFDPQGRYRPLWGWSARTAPAGGVDAAPYLGFPDLPGFGGLSLAVADPTLAGPQKVYAAAQLDFVAHAELILRLDVSGPAPGLFEPETVIWHGLDRTFPSALSATTPSGQPVATRAVAGFSMPPGVTPLFNDVAADGTLFTTGLSPSSNNVFPDADITRVGAFDPRTSQWLNIPVLTTKGADAIPARNGLHAGGFVADVQAIDHGNAVAFTISAGYPLAYAGDPSANPPVPPAPPAEGIWPTFGIIARTGQWSVIDQFTGGQLQRSAADPAVGRRACPDAPGIAPPGESDCGAPNEIAALPDSGDLIVTQYLGPGLMALHYAKDASGHYTVHVTAAYRFPAIPNPATQDPGDTLTLLPKEVQADPTGKQGDERFIVSFDIPGSPTAIMEFTYNANTGTIAPASPPISAGDTALGHGRYDKDGNLWAFGNTLVVYEKRTANPCTAGLPCFRKLANPASPASGGCSFDPNNTALLYFTNNNWGQVCPPDYEILQTRTVPSIYGFTQHPSRPIVAGIDLGGFDFDWVNGTGRASDPAQIIALRYAATGSAMTFEVGQVTNTGLGLFAAGASPGQSGEWKALRPGSFDASGRLWFAVQHIVNGAPTGVSYPHWVGAVDIDQLFDGSPPIALSAASGASTAIQAERYATFTTSQRKLDPNCRSTPTAPCTMLVDSTALVQVTSQPPGAGSGTELVTTDAGVGHVPGKVGYRIWAPAAGTYRIAYRVKGQRGATIALDVDGTASSPATAVSATSWGTVDGPAISLSQGLHELHLSPGSQGWHLDSFTLTRD